MSKFKGFRTLLVNTAILIVTMTAGMTGTIENPETLRYIILAQGAANLVLRFFSSTPVGKAE